MHELDWLHIQIAFARIQSHALSSLFLCKSPVEEEKCAAIVESIRDDLQRWKVSIPVRFRPDRPVRLYDLSQPHLNQVVLHTHFICHVLEIALARLMMHVCAHHQSVRLKENKKLLMTAARAILDVSHLVPFEPSTPIK